MPNSATAGSARANTKERVKKERQVRKEKIKKVIEAQRAKPLPQSVQIDALIGDEEQNKKQKK